MLLLLFGGSLCGMNLSEILLLDELPWHLSLLFRKVP